VPRGCNHRIKKSIPKAAKPVRPGGGQLHRAAMRRDCAGVDGSKICTFCEFPESGSSWRSCVATGNISIAAEVFVAIEKRYVGDPIPLKTGKNSGSLKPTSASYDLIIFFHVSQHADCRCTNGPKYSQCSQRKMTGLRKGY